MAAEPNNAGVAADSDRQTILASERTQLAWWRTGLTAIAVALAVGRILPDLARSGSRWAYTVIGMGFALYGIAMIAYGTIRARSVEEAIEGSRRPLTRDPVRVSLAAAGVVLGLASAAVILFS